MPKTNEDDAPDLDWRKDFGIKLESKWDGVVDFADGHVSGYSIERVLRGGFFKIKAPVFSEPFVLQQTIFVLVMTVLIAATFMILDQTNTVVMDSNLVGQSAGIFGYFGGMSGFLFGFFIFDQLATYVCVKGTYLGNFWGAFSELIFLTSVWFPGADKKTQEFKTTVVRWGMASFSLMCMSADSDTFSPEERVAACVRRSLLTAEEAAGVSAAGGNATIPLVWMFEVFEVNLKGQPGADVKITKIEDKILGMRANISNVLSAVSSFGLTPLPLIHLMSALVKAQLFFLGIKEGIAIADIMMGASNGKAVQVAFSLLMATTTPVMFQGLLEFVVMIRNPFGSDWIDLPISSIYRGMRDEMFQYVTNGEAAASLPSVKQSILG